MSNRTTGRIVGALFLAAFVCYGVGSALVDRPVGAALMLLNSVVVATIGALVFGIFRPGISELRQLIWSPGQSRRPSLRSDFSC